MSKYAILASKLTKKFRLFSNRGDRIKEVFHPFAKRYHKEFIALDSIDLKVLKGQTLGILGKNGSGKSTLLQIISGVLGYSSGALEVNGRISALLELGSGFNPEYTGRENVVFQAQMTGMSNEEIALKMPEIEAFADIGDFFDQPVKIYSTGMFVRVAFSIATSVDPDILIVDEALAVGDASFQEKCFRRLRRFKDLGKTIVFVSHSPDSITALCDYALILHEHKIYAEGEPRDIVDKYLKLILSGNLDYQNAHNSIISNDSIDALHHRENDFFDLKNATDKCRTRGGYNPNEMVISNGGAEVIDFYLKSHKDESVSVDHEIELYIKVRYSKNIDNPVIGFEIKSLNGIKIFATNTFLSNDKLNKAKAGDIKIYSYIFKAPLNYGDYFFDIGVAENDGTEGGKLYQLRKSLIHLALDSYKHCRFNGLINLSPIVSECE